MAELRQGDIIRICGYRTLFLVISRNAYIRATGMFHVCPVYTGIQDGPLHISVKGEKNTEGIAVCEQIKLIDPSARACSKQDWISYAQLINISDALQGIFEYD